MEKDDIYREVLLELVYDENYNYLLENADYVISNNNN